MRGRREKRPQQVQPGRRCCTPRLELRDGGAPLALRATATRKTAFVSAVTLRTRGARVPGLRTLHARHARQSGRVRRALAHAHIRAELFRHRNQHHIRHSSREPRAAGRTSVVHLAARGEQRQASRLASVVTWRETAALRSEIERRASPSMHAKLSPSRCKHARTRCVADAGSKASSAVRERRPTGLSRARKPAGRVIEHAPCHGYVCAAFCGACGAWP